MMLGRVSFNLRCDQHRRYNPELHGKGAIRGGCNQCFRLYEIYEKLNDLRLSLMDFEANNTEKEKNKCSY
jgi:hypothetical protein